MDYPPVRSRSVVALIALSVAAFAYVTSETLPIGLLGLISRGTHSSLSAVGLLVTWYGLIVVVATLPLTQLTRRVPRRRLLSALLGIFVLASLGSALASDYGLLLATRIATALSQAVFWAVVVSSAAGMFPPRVRGRAVGLVFAGSSLAALRGAHPAPRAAALALVPVGRGGAALAPHHAGRECHRGVFGGRQLRRHR